MHPEEILADNFVLWMTAKDNSSKLKSPVVISKMNDIISNATSDAEVTASQTNNKSS